MKSLLKILGVLVLLLLIVGVGAFAVINTKGIPTYEVEKVDFKSHPTPESIERGRVLVMSLCAGCHLDNETGALTGKMMLDAPPEFGVVYSPNITQDKEYGIGSWTDGEIAYLLRTGIKKTGQYAPPYMAKLPHLADDDMNAVISFLRSGNKAVAPVAKEDKPCEPSFLTKALCNAVFKPFPYPDHSIEMPDTNNKKEWGKYLVFNFECFSCHSADFKSNDFLNPEKSVGYLGGGNMMLNMEGEKIFTSNLTPHKELGIGSWTEEEFIKAVKYGIREGEVALRYPMQPYVHLSNSEIGAIYQYLQSVPPIENKIERPKI